MFVVERNSVMNHNSFLGSLAEPIHPADSGSMKNECHLTLWESGEWNAQWFASDSSTRLGEKGEVCVIDNYSWLTTAVNNAEPWSWVPMLIGNTWYEGEDGVVDGSGVKGRVNPEWIRVTVNGGPSNKQQLSSGNLIHVAFGLVLGWDPSNGAMS